jgi:hypothetical protein
MMPGLAVYSIYKFLKSGDLDSIKIKDLHLMEIQLNKKIDDIQDEIKEIATTIEKLLISSKETITKSEEISIANRIKTLNQKKEMKQNASIQLEKELRVVTNLLIIKENERDLKESGAWKKLQKMKPEKIERWLTTKTLKQKNRQELISEIVSVTSSAMENVEYDQDLDDILDVIRAVKKGDLEAKTASKKVMKEKTDVEK